MQRNFKYLVFDLIKEKAARGYSSARIRADLCRHLQISPAQLSRYINARQGDPTDISGAKLKIIADYFKVSVDYLFAEKSAA